MKETNMFTGIIEEVGTIRKVITGQTSGSIEIQASRVLQGTRTGDSIAVNGVCLTVTSMQADSFTADVMPETLRRSNLGSLRKGAGVNLDRFKINLSWGKFHVSSSSIIANVSFNI